MFKNPVTKGNWISEKTSWDVNRLIGDTLGATGQYPLREKVINEVRLPYQSPCNKYDNLITLHCFALHYSALLCNALLCKQSN